jgi:hypothetical protein
MSTEVSTTTKHHWHHSDVLSNYLKAAQDEEHGQNTLPTDGTLGHHWNITDATKST